MLDLSYLMSCLSISLCHCDRVQDLDKGNLKMWEKMAAPPIAISYWRLGVSLRVNTHTSASHPIAPAFPCILVWGIEYSAVSVCTLRHPGGGVWPFFQLGSQRVVVQGELKARDRWRKWTQKIICLCWLNTRCNWSITGSIAIAVTPLVQSGEFVFWPCLFLLCSDAGGRHDARCHPCHSRRRSSPPPRQPHSGRHEAWPEEPIWPWPVIGITSMKKVKRVLIILPSTRRKVLFSFVSVHFTAVGTYWYFYLDNSYSVSFSYVWLCLFFWVYLVPI